jgi:outer membrane protein assembly factor BamA
MENQRQKAIEAIAVNLRIARIHIQPVTKLHPYIIIFLLLSVSTTALTQDYLLEVKGVDRDSTWIVNNTGLLTRFTSPETARKHIDEYFASLKNRGYVTASIDSLLVDSASARMQLFIGEMYLWARLDAGSMDRRILDQIGWKEKMFDGKVINFTQVKDWEERILDYYEKNGYPFARVYLDSLQLEPGSQVYAKLVADPGPLYHIDSIRVYGNARITSLYLQRYLDLPNGSIYNKEKLAGISRKIRELAYIEETQAPDITMLGTGSVINLYLQQKKSSQVNVIVGFLPNNDQLSSKKLLLTGEANILLRNSLGSGETIGLNWQQIQVKSPRLNLLYQHPYLFRSPVGLDFSFEMFRKDSSFVNVNFQLGAHYILDQNQSGKLYIQRVQTIVNQGGIKTSEVIQTRRLPDIADIRSTSFGVEYDLNTTDYRFNPRKGNDLRLNLSIGTKKISRNNEIVDLKDPSDPSFDFGSLYDTVRLNTYQLRLRVTASRFIPLGRQSTMKTSVQGGYFRSGNIFRNELFQIGGYRLLRGFDEESQYVSRFAIGTVEYRLLYVTGQNSFFYALVDGGWGRTMEQLGSNDHFYFGTGLGLAFETKAGIFNLAWAVGKRDDTELNLRKSKIHFGFVNYF